MRSTIRTDSTARCLCDKQRHSNKTPHVWSRDERTNRLAHHLPKTFRWLLRSPPGCRGFFGTDTRRIASPAGERTPLACPSRRLAAKQERFTLRFDTLERVARLGASLAVSYYRGVDETHEAS